MDQRHILDALERLGNRIPDPVALFAGLGALTLLASKLAAMAGVSAIHPGTGEVLPAVDLLTSVGLRRMLTEAVHNFTAFPPLGTVLVAMIGIGLAEKAGLFDAALHRLERVPPSLLTPCLLFAGVQASIAADAGFVVLLPIGAALYARAGRPALAGLATAFAGFSGGFSANLLITGLDPLLAGLTESGARLTDPAATVPAVANWYFMAASVPLLVVVGTWVERRFVEPRLPMAAPLGASPGGGDVRPLQAAGATLLVAATVIALLAATALRGDDGTSRPLYDSTVVLVSLSFGAAGLVFGKVSGKFRSVADASKAASEAMSSLGGYLVMAFAAAQVVAWSNWSNLGAIAAIHGAALLGGAPAAVLLLGVVGITAGLDLLVASASAKWAVLAPLFVPMLGLLGVSPAATQAAYRVGDSVFNPICPLLPYLPLVLATARRYHPELGLGTLFAAMLPYSLAYLVSWTALLVAWFALGLPFGP